MMVKGRDFIPRLRRAIPNRSLPPVRTRNVPKRTIKSKNRGFFDIGSAIDDVVSVVTASVNKPTTLISLLFVSVIVYSHKDVFESGVIGQWLKDHRGTLIADWILSNSRKFLGMLTFLPSIIDIPKKTRTLAAFVSILWIYLLPAQDILEYILQAFALMIYFRTSSGNAHLLIVIVVLCAYFTGYMFQNISKPVTIEMQHQTHIKNLRDSLAKVVPHDRRKRSLKEILDFAKSGEGVASPKL
uniref:ORF3 n=1 Tax=Bemisia tabaci negevirus 1 TaxID=2840074 RepID=A0A8E8KRV7_9VIRU|nr:ORF3 [Bemisia tabaci negevirus 1]